MVEAGGQCFGAAAVALIEPHHVEALLLQEDRVVLVEADARRRDRRELLHEVDAVQERDATGRVGEPATRVTERTDRTGSGGGVDRRRRVAAAAREDRRERRCEQRRGGPWQTIEGEGKNTKPGTPPRATGKRVRELPLLERLDMDIRDRVATPQDWYMPFREATWEEALELTAQELLRIKAARGPNALACFSSAKCSNEENYLLMRMYRGAETIAGRR